MASKVLPIDAEGLKALGATIYKGVKAALTNSNVPDIIGIPTAGAVTGVALLFPALFAVVAQGVTGVGAFFAIEVLGLIGQMKRDNAEDFNTVIAASSNELLGTNITASQLANGGGSGPGMGGSKALGDALIGSFEEALGANGPVLPTDGRDNARKFAGFSVNFAMNEAFLSILTEAGSLGVLKEFKELPQAMRGALGLGRLQRAALAPLVRNAISQPYDLYLKYLMRPDRLAEGQIVRALRSGDLDDTTARQMLAEKGYRDSDIEILISDLTQRLSAGELLTLVDNGVLTDQQFVDQLSNAGMDSDNAKLLLQSLRLSSAQSQVSGILSDLEAAYSDGFIDQELYNATLDALPISDDEAEMFRKKVGLHQERTRKRISFAQLTKGVVNGIVDFTYMDTWLSAEGYSTADQDILAFEILEALKVAEDKVRFKEYKAAQLRAKGKPVPPWLM